MSKLESHPGITLKEHLLGVKERITKFCKDMKFHEEFCKVTRLAALTHDLGKATGYFQEHLKGRRVNPSLSSHALLSAIIAIWHVSGNLPIKWKLPLFITVRSHHSNPSNLSNMTYPKHEWKYLEKQAESIDIKEFNALFNTIGLETQFTNKIIPSFDKFRNKFSWSPELERVRGISIYLTTNLLLGMLVDADIRAVVGMDANEERVNIPPDIVDRFVKNLPKNNQIDSLRQDFYNTVVENIQRYGLENNFFTITAPTGIGKTFTGFSAAVKLRNLIQGSYNRIPRIIYVLPFTSIIDQNFEVIKSILKKQGLPTNILIKHHYRSSPEEKINGAKVENIWKFLSERNYASRDFEKILTAYEKAQTRTETWDGEIIVTTFVRLYETLFTNKRSEMRRLHRLAGSVVILDEVQNIPVKYWEVTEKSLDFLAKEWGTKFILMTATRPALFQCALELTQPKKEVFFKNLSRTELKIEGEPISYKEFYKWFKQKVQPERNFMIVLNTINSAQSIYKDLKKILNGFELYFLSASLIPIHRGKRIQEIKKKLEQGSKIGLVSTQVVEAGIDLDFNVVIRDLAPFDSIVQAAGRCNRNLKQEKGDVFFVTLINPEHEERKLALYVYDCVLINATEGMLKERSTLTEKEYPSLVETYFERLRSELKAQDREILKAIETLNYEKISEFSLIEKDYPRVPVFVEFDKKATSIIEMLKKLEELKPNTYKDRIRRRQTFKSLEPELWGYIVNVPLQIVSDVGLAQLPYASSILWLPRTHPDFDKIYDKDTGFTQKIKDSSIFL